ncbi:MAG TPA: methionyl-tRNA formyltransferase [Candidatus Saccharimonadales bacterium]
MDQKSRNNLIFFGTEAFSAQSLKALVKAGYQIAAVVTKPDSPAGRGGTTSIGPVKLVALRHRIKILQPAKLEGFEQTLKPLNPLLGVLVAYGQILPSAVLDVFDRGIVNLHPSKLPEYRGPSPIESALLHGDKETAVSLIKLTAKMDAGPIYSQHVVKINKADDRPTLYQRLGAVGSRLLVNDLEKLLDGSLLAKPQDESRATYTKFLKKNDGLIDWAKSAELIERQIRAFLGWPGSQTMIRDVRITIESATIGALNGPPGEYIISSNRQLHICCGNGSLMINKLRPAGRRTMTAKEFISGYLK